MDDVYDILVPVSIFEALLERRRTALVHQTSVPLTVGQHVALVEYGGSRRRLQGVLCDLERLSDRHPGLPEDFKLLSLQLQYPEPGDLPKDGAASWGAGGAHGYAAAFASDGDGVLCDPLACNGCPNCASPAVPSSSLAATCTRCGRLRPADKDCSAHEAPVTFSNPLRKS